MNSAVCDTPETTTVKEALSGADKEKWKTAMDKELQSIEKNEVWELESKAKRLLAPSGCSRGS